MNIISITTKRFVQPIPGRDRDRAVLPLDRVRQTGQSRRRNSRQNGGTDAARHDPLQVQRKKLHSLISASRKNESGLEYFLFHCFLFTLT
jgi:hypothetical protein